MARLNVNIKDSIYKRLVEEAEEEGRNVTDVVRVLIINYVQGQQAQREYNEQLRSRPAQKGE